MHFIALARTQRSKIRNSFSSLKDWLGFGCCMVLHSVDTAGGPLCVISMEGPPCTQPEIGKACWLSAPSALHILSDQPCWSCFPQISLTSVAISPLQGRHQRLSLHYSFSPAARLSSCNPISTLTVATMAAVYCALRMCQGLRWALCISISSTLTTSLCWKGTTFS